MPTTPSGLNLTLSMQRRRSESLTYSVESIGYQSNWRNQSMTMNQSRLMPRAKILVEAVRQITDTKEKVYGDPKVNLSCSGELKRVFLRYAARSPRQIGPAEQDAIDQALS